MNTIAENQARIDEEALAGRCFYCHCTVHDWDVEALHLANARGVTQHIHSECDKELREELAYDAWVEARAAEREAEVQLTAPSGLLVEARR